MMPPNPQTTHATDAGPVPIQRPLYRWYHKLSAVLLITFCLEVGLFLLIFPWTDYWGACRPTSC